MKHSILVIFLFGFFFASAQQESSKNTAAANWSSVSRTNYSIKCPSHWIIDTANSKLFGTDVIIFSTLSSTTDKFKENINLIVEDLQGQDVSLEKYVTLATSGIKKIIDDVEIIESATLKQGNREFQKLVFRGTQGDFDLKTIQYYFMSNGNVYVLTFTAENSEFDKYKNEAESILNSFRINNPKV